VPHESIKRPGTNMYLALIAIKESMLYLHALASKRRAY